MIIRKKLKNIMLNLENVKRKDNIITAEYYPEGNKADKGFIEYDITKNKVSNYVYSERDKETEMHSYFKKAVNAIEDMIEENNIQNSKLIMWY